VEKAQGLLAVLSAEHPIAGQLQTHHQNAAYRGFVVHHQKCGPMLTSLTGGGGLQGLNFPGAGHLDG
jgi:hypothetical protein